MSLFGRLFGSTIRISFYLFDSGSIERSVPDVSRSGRYGAYAQAQFLAALRATAENAGGWQAILGSGFMGFHGDLFDFDPFGRPTGTLVLAEWIKRKAGVIVNLNADFSFRLKTDPRRLGCLPYVVGVWPISASTATSVHNMLLSSKAVGYLGVLSLGPDPSLPFVGARVSSMNEAGMRGSDAVFSGMVSALGLSMTMGIRTTGQSFGWLVSDTELEEVGLSLLKQV